MSPLNSTTMASANSEEKTSASRMNNNMSTSGMPPGGRLKFFKGMVVLQKIQKFSSAHSSEIRVSCLKKLYRPASKFDTFCVVI